MFADEISDRLKVIACIEKPNMTHSESLDSDSKSIDFEYISKLLNAKDEDAQILLWGPEADIPTALETIEERCKMAFIGVPSETRKSLEKGTTMFERVLPGADRMYPDTDSAPISISEDLISNARSMLPKALNESIAQLENWNIPRDTFFYLLKNNLVPLMERISNDFKIKPIIVATLLAHRLKHLQGKFNTSLSFNFEKIYDLFAFMKEHNLEYDITYDMLPVIYTHPEMEMMTVLKSINFTKRSRDSILSMLPAMSERFNEINTSKDYKAKFRWMMKELRKTALGNIPLNELAHIIAKGEN